LNTGVMNYQIETLTPLHVGSGQKLLPADYVFDRANRAVVRVDLDALFRDRSFPIARYIEKVKETGFSMEREFHNSGLIYRKYELDAASNFSDLADHLGQGAADILEQIKEGGRPYLPGSSIKGAVRSLLLRTILKHDHEREIYCRKLEETLRPPAGRRIPPRNFFSSAAENRLLGQTNYSLLRVLQVGDSSLLASSNLELGCVRILSLTERGGYRWKDLGQGALRASGNQMGTPVFFEAIPAKTVFSGRIKIDTSLLTPAVARELRFTETQIATMKNIAALCREETESLLIREQEFFARLDLPAGIAELKRLQDEADACKANQFLLPVAWGTGHRAKTTGWMLPDTLQTMIRGEFRLGREGFVFPKSRKISFQNGQPAGLVGWTRVSLEVAG